MTKCNEKILQLSPLNRKKVEANFDGAGITSNAGLLLVRELDNTLGLTKRFSKAIEDQRDQSIIRHSIHNLVKQRVYAMACGYEDLNDHDELRHDLCLQTAIGKEVELASPSTLSRMETKVTRKTLIQTSIQMVENYMEQQQIEPAQMILDFDPTDHRLHGNQEKSSYHGYYKHDCYLPLLVFVGDHLLVSLLRPSNIDGAKYAGAILRLLVARIRQSWKRTKIIFRGDSAFARTRLWHWCEHNNVDYITGMAGNARLTKLAHDVCEKSKQEYEKSKKPQKHYDSFEYAAKSWQIERKVVVKSEHNHHGANTRFVVTNFSGTAQDLYESGYCPRGDMENKIKQLKLDLYGQRNSCTTFLGNQFRLLLSSIAYILMTTLRQLCFAKTKFSKAYCNTIRLKFIKIGAIILKNSRRIRVFFSNSCPYQAELRLAFSKLQPT